MNEVGVPERLLPLFRSSEYTVFPIKARPFIYASVGGRQVQAGDVVEPEDLKLTNAPPPMICILLADGGLVRVVKSDWSDFLGQVQAAMEEADGE